MTEYEARTALKLSRDRLHGNRDEGGGTAGGGVDGEGLGEVGSVDALRESMYWFHRTFKGGIKETDPKHYNFDDTLTSAVAKAKLANLLTLMKQHLPEHDLRQ